MKTLLLPIALAASALLGTLAPAVHAQSLPTASTEQLQAAKYALLGTYQCEFGQSISVQPDTGNPGYMDVRFQKQQMKMRPVLTSTGSLRLEDLSGHHLLLQIANKTMLMDQRAGKRVVDGCIHAAQRTAMRSAGLLD